jgi:RHS repeat-associated protein
MRTTSQGYGGSDSSRQRYALTERDEATGLDHTWWRKYENTAGGWTSPDPFKGSISDPQSFNLFTYVSNDPLNFIDPSGLCSWQAPYTPNPNGTITIGRITWLTPCNVSSSGGGGGDWLAAALGAAGFGRSTKRAITEGEPRGADKGILGTAGSMSEPKEFTKQDKWYGYNDKDFHKWFHRCWKEEGDADASREEVQWAYEEWVRRGKPKGGKCWGGGKDDWGKQPATNPVPVILPAPQPATPSLRPITPVFPVPGWLPTFPVLPIMINPCIVDRRFCDSGSGVA